MRYNLGDAPTIDYKLRNPDGQLTAGTVAATFTKPDGSIVASSGVTTSGVGLYRITCPPVDQAGAWRYTITATGTATDTTDGAFVVTAANADQPWAPALAEVGARIPMRTIELGSVTGLPTGTFTSLTMPDDVQVSLLVDGAVATIAATAGDVDATLWGLASEAAALRAAAAVELAQPGDQFDPRRYDQLNAAADGALTRLAARNESVTGASTAATGMLMPVGSFPEPVAWGDWNL